MPEPFETLKQILRHARNPELLNDHPWTQSLFVQEAVLDSPQLREVCPGQQLIGALAWLFPQVQPATPPRHGKRLDPRWGEFGLLAALYFTPFNHGTSYPSSLIEAWGRIDPAILYFVYGRPAETLCQQEIKKYELVGADLEYGAASTLSDWHKKGLQRLSEVVLNHERCLARNQSKASILLEPALPKAVDGSKRRRVWRWAWLALVFILLLALGLGGFKSWKVYQLARPVYQDVTSLQSYLSGPLDVNTVEAAVPRLETLQADLAAFKAEARPFLLLGPKLDWVPVYGGDLAAAPALVELAEHLLKASLLAAQAADPLLEELDSQASALDPGSLTALLVEAQPGLVVARQELDAALVARDGIDAERLSPPLQGLMVEELDPILKLADEGLSLAGALPSMLGAGKDGPKTYLLLAQNEDEIRPTGGFITSVGNLVLHNGEIISLEFEGVDNEQEDWSKPYPSAPWQLQEYMNSRVLVLRDANWFTDFPTTAMWVEYLYAYTHSHSVDGMIAFDQRFLVMLLDELGPLTVKDAPYPITADNVIAYMRQAKVPPEEPVAGWYRKEFISDISAALLAELTSGESHNWRGLLGVLSRALSERHLLLQFDDPTFGALAAERGWDGAVRPVEGDFLMVTDTNIGFNKTSAVVDVSLAYDVDLTDVAAPESTLTVTHQNNASQGVPCILGRTLQVPGERDYPINRCYWTYLRAYKQAEVELVDSMAHSVPGGWTLLGETVPPRVDVLDEELQQDAQGFGTLVVVPGDKSLSTRFKFSLPKTVFSTAGPSGELTYRLHIQKQPGTLANLLTIRIHLPNHATLRFASSNALIQGQNLLIETDLCTDVEIEVNFTVP
jgi:hypothetical protein